MAYTSYTPYEWKNAPDHKTTPLSADNLNHMEGGIADSYKFDNTGTNLSSTNKEDAIKEVNAKTQHGIVELWKNNNISVSRPTFAGQSIQIQNFDANKYDSIVVAHGYSDEAEGVQWTEFTKDVLNISRTFYLDYKGWNGANGKLIEAYREISFSLSGTTLTITVSDCTRLTINTYGTTSGQTSETQNGLMVPIRILGLIHND
jgi:hypothetical protein